MTDETKILVTALVTSFFTVCVIEPVKAWLQRRRVRRWLYSEMVRNCAALSEWVVSAKPYPKMQEHTAVQFASEYRKLAYEFAIKDAGFYSLRRDELHRIDRIFREFERISSGAYEPQECFQRAEVAAASVFLAVQDRLLSRRIVFSVSTRCQKQYLREHLPHHFLPVNHDDAPPWLEKARHYGDAVLFWYWRKRTAMFQKR